MAMFLLVGDGKTAYNLDQLVRAEQTEKGLRMVFAKSAESPDKVLDCFGETADMVWAWIREHEIGRTTT